jgi:CheY-like chemotaxis protein
MLDDEYCQLHPGARPGWNVMLTVTDSGSGMDDATLSHIFEPFFSTKPVGKGTGLGLATVYGIVKQHNGFIDVMSMPASGTTFRIFLPLSEESGEAKASPPVNAGRVTPLGNATILLVEDNEMVMEMTRELLENSGCRVLSAYFPEDALNISREFDGKINLLLSDVVMPQMNGPELHGRLKEIFPDLPVLYMSGYIGNVVVTDGTLEEAATCISKPFTAETLLEEVAKILV